jgi:uncharacterized protein YkwD
MPSTDEAALLDLLNAYRTVNGLPVLARDGALDFCASVKMADQLAARHVSHVEASGRDLRGLMAACGISQERTYAELLGEARYADGRPGEPAFMLAAWMDSPTHAAMLADRRYTYAGVAAWGGYWVLHLRDGD